VLDIRPLCDADAPAVHRLLGDPEVAAWFSPDDQVKPYTLTDCQKFVQSQMGHWAAHGFGMCLGWDGATCVGWSLLQHTIVDGFSEVEIGWTVASPCWRQGIGTRLGQHALERAGELGLRSIIAYARIENGASRRIMEKLGLSYEREFARDGRPHVLYRRLLAAPPKAGEGASRQRA
jgi:RimJ/RimL family protein N-acetyltransferase